MNVVAWVLVATSGLLGASLVFFSYRRSISSGTIVDLQRSGLAMPANSHERTVQFLAGTSRVPSVVGVHLLATRKRQPHMLTHLWPEVAATRAAGPTPAQSEVVAP